MKGFRWSFVLQNNVLCVGYKIDILFAVIVNFTLTLSLKNMWFYIIFFILFLPRVWSVVAADSALWIGGCMEFW